MFAVRVPEDYVWVVGRHVDEGQSVVPGAALMDVMTPEGVVETIFSKGWGIVAHVEGNRTFRGEDMDFGLQPDNDALCADGDSEMVRFSGGMGAVYARDSVICHIVARSQEGSTVRKAST
jgi:hypothetical protein